MKLLLLKCTMDVALAIGVRGAAGCGGGKCEEGVYVGSMWPQNITQSVGQWRNEWSCVYAFTRGNLLHITARSRFHLYMP